MNLGRGKYQLLKAGEVKDDEGKVLIDLGRSGPYVRGVYPTLRGEIATLVPIGADGIRSAKRRCRQAALEFWDRETA